ncbi:hypothetical protein FB45DRAFT_1012781 [Roridomyces roridus]|nr:hypothetical protein FB45DRAFT_1012781 [Roridomyces roridus]
MPALRSVDLDCNFVQAETFFRIWEQASPTIKVLALACRHIPPSNSYPTGTPPIPSSSGASRVALDALELDMFAGVIGHWLRDPNCPFDLSRLQALSVHWTTNAVFQWPVLLPALENIENLRLVGVKPSLDLSVFPNLKTLHLAGIHINRLVQALSSVAYSQHLHTIRINTVYFPDDVIEKIQSVLKRGGPQGPFHRLAILELEPMLVQAEPVLVMPGVEVRFDKFANDEWLHETL